VDCARPRLGGASRSGCIFASSSNLEESVPEDHQVRRITEVLDLSLGGEAGGRSLVLPLSHRSRSFSGTGGPEVRPLLAPGD
jgi:hypothetical protein